MPIERIPRWLLSRAHIFRPGTFRFRRWLSVTSIKYQRPRPWISCNTCKWKQKVAEVPISNTVLYRRLPPNATTEHLRHLFNLTLLPVGSTISNRSLQIYDSILNRNNITLTELSIQLSPDCLEMISRCIWKGINTRCESLFQRIVTLEGICCSFNYFGAMTNNFPRYTRDTDCPLYTEYQELSFSFTEKSHIKCPSVRIVLQAVATPRAYPYCSIPWSMIIMAHFSVGLASDCSFTMHTTFPMKIQRPKWSRQLARALYVSTQSRLMRQKIFVAWTWRGETVSLAASAPWMAWGVILLSTACSSVEWEWFSRLVAACPRMWPIMEALRSAGF